MQAKPQSLEDALLSIAGNGQMLGIAMVLVTLLSLLIGYLLQKSNRQIWANRFMCVPIFITTIPGIFFSLILAYLLFLTSANLLTVPLFFFFPPLWMAVSLYLFSQLVDFARVPGFDRLSGLALFTVFSFVFVFILFKIRFLAIVWFNPVWLLFLVVVFYVGGRLALKRMFHKSEK